MSVRADVETIRNIPIFSECDPAHLQLLVFSAVRETFQPGEALITAGEPARAAFIVLNGTAEILSASRAPIGTAGPGALLGEVAMIGGSPYSVTARAIDTMATARIDRELFMRVAREFPEFGAAVFRRLALKLDLSVKDLDGAREMLETARSFRSL